MGIMPEGRERRWREIFRRYGLSTGTNAEPTPPANLHLTLLEKVGVRLDRFADSQGTIKELLAV